MKTTNLKTSKKLKELGFEAETIFYFLEVKPNIYEVQYSAFNRYNKSVVKSYDLEIILEALPYTICKNTFEYTLSVHQYVVAYTEDSREDGDLYGEVRRENESLANTAGRLLIKLLEDNIIKLGE